jgi:hypothetical protein
VHLQGVDSILVHALKKVSIILEFVVHGFRNQKSDKHT